MSNIPPEMLNDPNYDPRRFPQAFEDNLLMVLKPNHLYAERLNLKNPYEVDFAIKRSDNNEILFYAEAEFDASGKCFDSDGELTYEKINVLARKKKFFLKDKPTVFVKGNVQYVFVVDTAYILKFAKEMKIPCTFRRYNKPINTFQEYSKNVAVKIDNVLQIDRRHATESGALRHGSLQNWLQYVKDIHQLGGLKTE